MSHDPVRHLLCFSLPVTQCDHSTSRAANSPVVEAVVAAAVARPALSRRMRRRLPCTLIRGACSQVL